MTKRKRAKKPSRAAARRKVTADQALFGAAAGGGKIPDRELARAVARERDVAFMAGDGVGAAAFNTGSQTRLPVQTRKYPDIDRRIVETAQTLSVALHQITDVARLIVRLLEKSQLHNDADPIPF